LHRRAHLDFSHFDARGQNPASIFRKRLVPKMSSWRQVKYLRFVVAEVDGVSRQRQGIFHAAGVLLESADITPAERQTLEEAVAWFESHLPAPDSSCITATATFWFRAEAKDCISRVWLLVGLLRAHGHLIEIQRRRWLNLVYQDEYQAAGHAPKS